MAQLPKLLASSWSNGLFVLDGDGPTHELPKRSVRGLSDHPDGGALAVVDGHSLFQRSVEGDWNQLASSEYVLSATFSVNNSIFTGTDDARVLVLDEEGSLRQIDNFDSIEGRDSWFAGTAIVDGRVVGPPLGIRSLSGAASGLLFANVHVGGIPKSVDGGQSWIPTIDVNLDAHEVRVNPDDDRLVVAATAAGLCISHDSGGSWSIHTKGLHAPYCSAVAITGDNIFVAASESHFAADGGIYRRSTEPGDEPMVKVQSGLPNWLDGIVDTSCIAANLQEMAVVDARGNVYGSNDTGAHWLKYEETLPGTSSLLIVS